MATYVNDLRLKEIATGDESGTWGTSTNTNLELIAEAFSYSTVATFDTDADKTETIADGATDPYRSIYVKVTSGVSLTATRTLTIAPNDVSKIFMIENATSGSQSIAISQGSGANVTIPNGDVKVIYTDGAGAGAAVVDAFANLKVTDPAQTNITSVGALDGGSITSGFGSINVGSSAITTTGTVTGTTLAGTLSTAAQTNITSVGTLSSLTVSGDATFDTSTLKVDSTNNRVGIGTTSPAANLEIGGVTDPDIYLTSSNTLSTGALYFGDSGGDERGFVKYLHNGDKLAFGTNGSEVGRFDSSGNFGIGTTSPSALLHLDASSNAQIRFSDTEDPLNNFIGLETLSDGLTIACDEGNASVNSRIIFKVDGSEVGRFEQGDFGIGTASPSSILHLYADDPQILLDDLGTQSSITGQSGNILYKTSSINRDHIFYGVSTEVARITGDGGITFNGDTAEVNTLDDYEEGTWTPAGVGVTFTGAYGHYQKIGNRVFVSWYVQYPSTSDGTQAQIDGLPFTAKDYPSNPEDDANRGFFTIGYNNNGNSGNGFRMLISTGTNNVLAFNFAGASIANSAFSGTAIYGGGSYIT